MSSAIPIKDRVSIYERPAVVDARSRFGDWEMNTIIGKDGKGAIVTLVERTSKKMLMARSPKGKNAKSVARLVVQMLRPFERHVLSITTDNGTEFADHKLLPRSFIPKSISLTPIPLGRKVSLRTPTSSLDNLSQKTLFSPLCLTITSSLSSLSSTFVLENF